MKLEFLLKNRYTKDILITLVMGSLSLLLGLVKIYIPGLEGTASDMREIPLLIGIFHLSNPLYAIGLAAISCLSIPSGIPYFPTFAAHVFSLMIYWFLFQYLKKRKTSYLLFGVNWFISSVLFFLVILIPLIFVANKLYGLNAEDTFINFYKDFLNIARFEIMTTSIIISMYMIQDRIRRELKQHKEGLEVVVKNRTEELETANEELTTLNSEMYEKSNIIHNKNEELKATLKQLKDTQANLIQIEKMASLGVLTAGVAHEINNPLNYIMGGYVGLKHYFEDHNCPETENIDILLDAIETGVDRASGIVKGLNQFSRDNEANNELCNLHSIIDNCLIMIHNQIKLDIDVERRYDDDLPDIRGNVGKLHQVFVNILTNANQAIEGKGKISVRSKKDKENIYIEIHDTGVGMDKEILTKVTDPFFTTKDPGNGTGLGLSISYNIIKEHFGEMVINSEKNIGTTIKIMFPVN